MSSKKFNSLEFLLLLSGGTAPQPVGPDKSHYRQLTWVADFFWDANSTKCDVLSIYFSIVPLASPERRMMDKLCQKPERRRPHPHPRSRFSGSLTTIGRAVAWVWRRNWNSPIIWRMVRCTSMFSPSVPRLMRQAFIGCYGRWRARGSSPSRRRAYSPTRLRASACAATHPARNGRGFVFVSVQIPLSKTGGVGCCWP